MRVAHEYSWSGSSRFAWSLGYVLLLSITAYGFGLPEQPRTRRVPRSSRLVATTARGRDLGRPCSSSSSGDALLPRFVVLGSAVILVPWYVLCSCLARDAHDSRERTRPGRRRGASRTRSGPSKPSSNARRSAPAVLVGVAHAVGAAVSTSMPPTPTAVGRGASGRTRRSSCSSRAAQADDDIVAQASILHEDGVRIRTLSLFYEQWLGKLPIGELERVSLLFDIGELHAAGYARVKRLLDVALATLGLVALALVTPVVVVGDLARQPRIAAVTASRGPDATAPRSRC